MQRSAAPGSPGKTPTARALVAIRCRDGVPTVSAIEGSMSTETTVLAGAHRSRKPGMPADVFRTHTLACEWVIS